MNSKLVELTLIFVQFLAETVEHVSCVNYIDIAQYRTPTQTSISEQSERISLTSVSVYPRRSSMLITNKYFSAQHIRIFRKEILQL